MMDFKMQKALIWSYPQFVCMSLLLNVHRTLILLLFCVKHSDDLHWVTSCFWETILLSYVTL